MWLTRVDTWIMRLIKQLTASPDPPSMGLWGYPAFRAGE